MTDEIKRDNNTKESDSENNRELTRDNIAHMLEVLGEDVINDMLGIDDSETETESTETDSPYDVASEKAPFKLKSKKSSHRRKVSSRMIFVILFLGIIFVFLAINRIYMMVSINSNDPIQYSEVQDDISCSDGLLRINNVSVSIPSNGKEKYSISYSWSAEDTEYPSTPHAITAIYPSKKGSDLYSLSLYRNETIPEQDIPAGKAADNWFDDWKKVSDEDVVEKPLNSKTVSGYYIAPAQREAGANAGGDYNNYSYYFSVADEKGINIYVLEGICLDDENDIDLTSVMNDCIQTIAIK